jgi:hypothetical protein
VIRLRALYHLVRADFLDRVRRYSFLVVLGATAFLGYAFVAGHIVMRLDRYCGVYNSAWVGLLAAITAAFFLSLAGFYVVKNTLERDRHTGVGQIIAATPVSRLTYVLGKAISNLAVFALMTGVLVLAAVGMQLLRGQDLHIRLWPIVSPFLLILLPTMAVVAVLAVLFETLPGLRGGLGNVAFFFLWGVFLIWSFEHPGPWVDLLSMALIQDAFGAAARSMGLDYGGGMSIEMVKFMPCQTIHWEGVAWTPGRVGARLYWVGMALAFVLIATVLFDRFDPARGLFHRYGTSFGQAWRSLLSRSPRRRTPRRIHPDACEAISPAPAVTGIQLSPLVTRSAGFRFGQVLLAELRLMLKGQRWWWYAIALGLAGGGLFSLSRDARQTWLPLTWIWPVLIWSAMGARESRCRTGQLVFSAAHPLRRQFPATWLAGVILALLTGSGVAVRLLLDGDWAGMSAWLTGALFIPALALAMGCWSRNSKLFEAVYTILWYAGPVEGISALDFMGASGGSVSCTCRPAEAASSPNTPLIYLVCTIVLLALAIVGRKRQLEA